MNEAMKPKLLWRPQDTGDVGAMGHQWKKSAGMGRSWPKRELHGQTKRAGLLKIVGAQVMPSRALEARHGALRLGGYFCWTSVLPGLAFPC